MQFRPSGKWKKEMVTSDQIPDDLQKLSIPGSISFYCKGSFGYYLSQQSKWNGMDFQQSNLFIDHRVVLEGYIQNPFIYLMYFLKGGAAVRLNGTLLKSAKNTYWLCYFPRGRQQCEVSPGQHTWFWIGLKYNYLKHLAAKLPEVSSLLAHARKKEKSAEWVSTGQVNHAIRQLISKITNCNYESPERELYIQSQIKQLLAFCSMHLKVSSGASNAPYLLQKNNLAAYIEPRLNDTMTIETIAMNFHVSTSALKKTFRRLFEVPVHQYIQEQRLQKAKHLIENTTLSIYEISLRTGFTDASHLIKRFKIKFSDTPEQFRRKNKPAR